MGLIVALIRRNRWDDLIELLSTPSSSTTIQRPGHFAVSELSIPDRLGRTPLHYACAKQQVPSHVVPLMLGKVNRSKLRAVLLLQDVGGNTVLHNAAACGNAQVVRVLLEQQVKFPCLNDLGLTPLMMAWRKFLDPSFTLFRRASAVVMASPGLVTLLTQIQRFGDLEWLKILQPDPDADAAAARLVDLWNKTMVLIYAEVCPDMEYPLFNGIVWRPLHTLITVGGRPHVQCPSAAVWMAIQIHKDHLTQPDKDGYYPLHLAAMYPSCPILPLQMPPSSSVQDASRSVLAQLCAAKPSMARIAINAPDQPRLPLHLAIDSGKPWHDCIQALVRAHPEALQRRDGSTRLYPFLQAAASPRASLTVTWELLRASPDLLIITNNAASTSNAGKKRKSPPQNNECLAASRDWRGSHLACFPVSPS